MTTICCGFIDCFNSILLHRHVRPNRNGTFYFRLGLDQVKLHSEENTHLHDTIGTELMQVILAD